MTLGTLSSLGDDTTGADLSSGFSYLPADFNPLNSLPVDTTGGATTQVLNEGLQSGTTAPSTAGASSPATAFYLIGGAVLLALMLK